MLGSESVDSKIANFPMIMKKIGNNLVTFPHGLRPMSEFFILLGLPWSTKKHQGMYTLCHQHPV